MTANLLREIARLRAAGTKVTLLTPGPEDLAVIRANLMDASRRHDVLETSLRTSARSLAAGSATLPRAAVSSWPVSSWPISSWPISG